MRLASKIVLVMGGGADGPPAANETLAIGIGRAIAMRCAREGAAIMVADRNFDSAKRTVTAIREEGHHAEAIACDVIDAKQCERAIAETVRLLGAVHVLANNAAISDFTGVTKASDEDFQRVLQVNVRGAFLATKYALPAIARAGGGAIVNISSIAALHSGAGSGVAYDTSKAALLALTRNAALEGAAHNVRVNALLPGVIDSTMLRRYAGDAAAGLSSRIPVRRVGTPWDVAKAAAFLASDDASYVTGTTLIVDGGITATLNLAQ
jgi:NAD(P)-dependent dehydrogenase (short-subunit alcohol dehydrogenase family)